MRPTHRRFLLGLLAAASAAGALLGLGLDGRGPAPGASPSRDAVLRSMDTVLRRDGLAAALDSLGRRAEHDTTLLRDAHQMAHALGREAVALRGGDAAVVRECSPAFASGCFHGVVEASLHAAGRVDMPRLEALCVGVEGAGSPGAGFECLHGLGHGVLGAEGYDIAAALRDCDALSTPRRAASCQSGAFMEAVNAALGAPAMPGPHAHPADHEHQTAHQLAIDPADPYSPCRTFADPYAASCWLFQGYVILRAHGFDAGRALAVCDSAPDGRAPRCYEGVGHQLTGLFQRGDRWVLEQCALGQPGLAAQCAAGATLALNAMDWSGSRAARLCAAAPASWKETCYRTAAGALVDLASAEERARMCAAIEPGYSAACREAAELAGKNPREGASTRTAGS